MRRSYVVDFVRDSREEERVRSVWLTAAGLAAALGVAAGAAAVDDEPERVATVSGTLAREGDGFRLAGKELGVGARWWRETAKVADFDGDRTTEAVTTELEGLAGKTVAATGEVEGDELSVRTLNGKPVRAAGKPPWAGGPNRGAKCKAKAAKRAAKAKAKGGGPPPWAKAHGRRC
jgi:hypothetical protein